MDWDDYEERSGPGKRKRTATAPTETGEEEIQYLGRKPAEVERRRHKSEAEQSIETNDSSSSNKLPAQGDTVRVFFVISSCLLTLV